MVTVYESCVERVPPSVVWRAMSQSSEPVLDLADLRDFGKAVLDLRVAYPQFGTGFNADTQADGLYCAVCGGRRRMYILRMYWRANVANDFMGFVHESETPALFGLTCLQCETEVVALVYMGPDGPDLAILSSRRGGLSTPNTPENVAYYLDQAHRAESVSATSAATAMYRSALEMLLYEQGYVEGMLRRKIDNLLSSSTPPAWLEQIDSDYLAVIKNLADGAIHPNDGDVGRQKILDRNLLAELRVVFEELLDVVYERPVRSAARKAKLKSALEALET